MKKYISAITGYTVGTFILAIVWHIVLFEPQYKAFNYIEGEPNFALGFTTILLQAIILSVFFAHLHTKMNISAFTYVMIMGFFFWTSHVLAFVAKQEVLNALVFISMETAYLILQFGLYGIILRWLYGKQTPFSRE